MSKPYINPNLSPEVTPSRNMPKTETPKTWINSPLTDSVHRLEEQNQAALQTLSQLHQMMDELIEVSHADSKKMDVLNKAQDILIDGQADGQKERQETLQYLQTYSSQNEEKQQQLNASLNEIKEAIEMGSQQTVKLTEEIRLESASEHLAELVEQIKELRNQQSKETESVREGQSLLTLLVEEMARKQVEMEKGQSKGFKRLLEKLNLVKNENEQSHDTHLENQKLMVEALYKLLNEEKLWEKFQQELTFK